MSLMWNPTRNFFYNEWGKFCLPWTFIGNLSFFRQNCQEVYNVWSHLYILEQSYSRKKKIAATVTSEKVGVWSVRLIGKRHNETFQGYSNMLFIKISQKWHYWQRIVTGHYPLDVITTTPLLHLVRTTKNISRNCWIFCGRQNPP